MTRLRPKAAEDVADFKYFNTLEDWADRWEFKQPGWQLSQVNPLLVKHFHRLADQNKQSDKQSSLTIVAPRPLRVFLPLCGKTRDLKWLYDQGCSVVAIEFCRNIVEELFAEAGFEDFKVEHLQEFGGNVYKTLDDRFQIFQGDFFKLSEAFVGKVDAVWDRDAFSAINVEDRVKYLDRVKSLMTADARILLDSPLYDDSEYLGDPHPLLDADIKQLLETSFHVQLLDSVDCLDEEWKGLGLSSYVKRLHLLTPKLS